MIITRNIALSQFVLTMPNFRWMEKHTYCLRQGSLKTGRGSGTLFGTGLNKSREGLRYDARSSPKQLRVIILTHCVSPVAIVTKICYCCIVVLRPR